MSSRRIVWMNEIIPADPDYEPGFGPCAKQTVQCVLVTRDSEKIVGTNHCANPQAVCPRAPGEGYDKCKTICQQEGHAEEVALRKAGSKAYRARAYITGHSHACANCQHELFAAGVASLTIGEAP